MTETDVTRTDDALEPVVREVLTDVLDPCSCFTKNPTNIVDLGLVEEVRVDRGTAHVRMLLTSQMCMYFVNMSREIKEKVGDIDGIDEVSVTQETDKIWTRERMSEDLQQEREQLFEHQLEQSDLTPYVERAGDD